MAMKVGYLLKARESSIGMIWCLWLIRSYRMECCMRPFGSAALFSAVLVLGVPALAASYDFVPAPQTDLNRIYRIDRITGEVSSCQYGLQEGTIGVTLCFSAGEGAGAQTPGEYGLVASRHEREGGVFRVNFRTGQMSICYVFDERVVCTPQTTPSPAASTAAPPAATPSVSPGTGASPQRP
jgi:hypothetical protein